MKAVLILESGQVYYGCSIGAKTSCFAELVFNTSMFGYQEIITDPSYCDQMVCFTYPHIGNVGVNEDDCESETVWMKGVIIRDLPVGYSSWRGKLDLDSYLFNQGVVGIAGVDTRKLTNALRKHGSMKACIAPADINKQEIIQRLQRFSSLENKNLVQKVSTKDVYEWRKGLYFSEERRNTIKALPRTLVVIDFGVKQNILRYLFYYGFKVVVVPWNSTYEQICSFEPDGVLLSNGPGDPRSFDVSRTIKKLLQNKLPLFGICLGCQLLALSLGASITKMKFGHHGANHPVKNIDSGKIFLSSQNHGYVISDSQLPEDCIVTYRSLFDNTIQGISHKAYPAFGFQGHPEASPGPQELKKMFLDFFLMVNQNISITSGDSIHA